MVAAGELTHKIYKRCQQADNKNYGRTLSTGIIPLITKAWMASIELAPLITAVEARYTVRATVNGYTLRIGEW